MIPRPTHEVDVLITRFVEAYYPPIIEWRLTDIHGHEWVFVGKCVYVSSDYFGDDSEYPQSGSLGCVIVDELTDEAGERFYRIDTDCSWPSDDGVNIFDVRRVKPVSY